jgi:hypothetical protein
MKHLSLFENLTNKLYICSIVDPHSEPTIYVFDSKKSMNNFLINYIHDDYTFGGDDSIDDIFDVEQLLEIFNNDSDNTIYINDGEFITNVKLNPELEIRMNAKNYNL